MPQVANIQKPFHRSHRQNLHMILIILLVVVVAGTLTYHVATSTKYNGEASTAKSIFNAFKEHAPQIAGTTIYYSHNADTNGDRGLGSIFAIEHVNFYYRDDTIRYITDASSAPDYLDSLYKQFVTGPYWKLSDESPPPSDPTQAHYNFTVESNDKRCQSHKCWFIVTFDKYNSMADLTNYVLPFETGYKPIAKHFAASTAPVYAYSLLLEYHPSN